VFKFGSGILGKSAIVLGVLLIGVPVAIYRLHSDWAIIGVLGIGAVIFFTWLLKVLKFSVQHPDLAMLDGAEWTGYKRFEAAAKETVPTPEQRKPALGPDSSYPIDIEPEPKRELGQ